MIKTLADALAERGYETLTPVQEAVAAPELAGHDLLVSAQTGSGKTVGFGLAIAPTILEEDGFFGPAAAPLALCVAPTRELAIQVMRELAWLYAKAGVRVASCVGGMDMRDERRALERGAHIVVGTPGRLRDHITRRNLDLGDIRAIVLDEADEMLDLGFREDLEFMLSEAPEERRTLLFSATVPQSIIALAQRYQRDAKRISTLTGASQHADIEYQAIRVAHGDVENAVINVLRFHEAQSAIVFANTRAGVNHLTARFSNRGFQVVSLSGELSQNERTHALQAMRDGRARVCIATDVAARGIDLPNLELVIHADLPTNAEGLLHRSGRTGRAGRKGISALIIPPKDVKKADRLLKTARIVAEWIGAPSADAVRTRDEERLLSDPAWQEEPSEEQATFAEKLLARHSPDKIAAAFLRLHQLRYAPPEELVPLTIRSAPEGRKAGARFEPEPMEEPFGPSRWFALSVGRNERAEPRWLLPMLCRVGKIERNVIGAIRVQDYETHVELTERGAERFIAALRGRDVLEQGIRILPMNDEFDTGNQAPEQRPAAPQPARQPARQADYAGDRPRRARPAPQDNQGWKPREERQERDKDPAPYRPEDSAPYPVSRDERGHDAQKPHKAAKAKKHATAKARSERVRTDNDRGPKKATHRKGAPYREPSAGGEAAPRRKK